MLILPLLLAAACSGAVPTTTNGSEEPPDDDSPTVSTVEVSPPVVDLRPDSATTLTLDVTTADGEPLSREGEWSVRDSTVAALEGAGQERTITARTEGSTRVVVTVEGVRDSAQVNVSSPSVSTVEVSPPVVDLRPDSSTTLTLDATTDDGEPLSREGEWSVRDPAVARLEGTGQERTITARSEGSTRVVVTVEGVRDSAQINVSGGADPAMVLDFEKYETTEELREDPQFIENQGLDEVYLDTGVGFGDLTQSMRYDWVDQGCNSVSRGRGLELPEPTKEVWIEVVFKTSENFTIANSACPPPDWKFIFGQVKPDGNERFDFMMRGPRMSSPYASTGQNYSDHLIEGNVEVVGRDIDPADDSRAFIDDFLDIDETELWDGRWHVVRIHWKAATDEAATDGHMDLWIDGYFLGGIGNFKTADVLIGAILLGRNKDKGVDQGVESLWIGRFRAWLENPIWPHR